MYCELSDRMACRLKVLYDYEKGPLADEQPLVPVQYLSLKAENVSGLLYWIHARLVFTCASPKSSNPTMNFLTVALRSRGG